jgi:hypothetical protein
VATIALVALVRWLPDGTGERAGLGLLLLALALPPAVLLAFYLTLREVLELPGRLRRLPDLSREHAAELGELAREAGGGDRPAWRRLPGSTWRLARLVHSGRDLLAPHAPLVALLSPPFLVASLIAALVTPVLLVVALVVVAVALA